MDRQKRAQPTPVPPFHRRCLISSASPTKPTIPSRSTVTTLSPNPRLEVWSTQRRHLRLSSSSATKVAIQSSQMVRGGGQDANQDDVLS